MPTNKKFKLIASSAFAFVFTMGIVNLFSDMTYEGASSINGPFLKTLGASALIIGVISGVGEFLGYSLRFISGIIADKTGKYWPVTFIGYIINLLAVPALALAGNLPIAAALVIAERVGRAIRKPSVESMLSYTTSELGKGWVYGLNTALDQTGATIGPLLMAFVLVRKGDFRTGYSLLLISAVLALITLTIARFFFPRPSRLEAVPAAKLQGFTNSYWLYMLAGGCVAAGLISFELISYHFSKTAVVPDCFDCFFPFLSFCTICFLRKFLCGTDWNDTLGNWVWSTRYASESSDCQCLAKGAAQSCFRTLLHRLWHGLVTGKCHNRFPLRALTSFYDCILCCRTTHRITNIPACRTKKALNKFELLIHGTNISCLLLLSTLLYEYN